MTYTQPGHDKALAAVFTTGISGGYAVSQKSAKIIINQSGAPCRTRTGTPLGSRF
jgi:hypothetical protein